MKKKFLLFVFALVAFAIGAPEWMDIDDYSDVSALLDDGAYMWVGRSNNGVVRVKRFLTERAAFGEGVLPANKVQSLAKGPDGEIWVGTSRGLARYSAAGTWKSFEYGTADYDLTNGSVLSLVVDAAGMLWVGTAGGLGKFDRNSAWTEYSAADIKQDNANISALAIDGSGNLWAGALGSGVSKYNGLSWTAYKTELPNRIRSLAAFGSTLWVGTIDGLARFNGSTWSTYTTTTSGIPNNLVNCLAVEPNGNVWVGTASGLARFTGSGWTSYKKSEYPSMPGDVISALRMDAQGNLWMGAFFGRLAVYKEGGIVSIRRPVSYPANGVFFLDSNFPNPFSATTSIRYRLNEGGTVVLRLLDSQGREVSRLFDAPQVAGAHTIQLKAETLPAGSYVCELRSGQHAATRKLTVGR